MRSILLHFWKNLLIKLVYCNLKQVLCQTLCFVLLCINLIVRYLSQAGVAGILSHKEVFTSIYNTLKQVFKCKTVSFKPFCWVLIKISCFSNVFPCLFLCRCGAIHSSRTILCWYCWVGYGKQRKICIWHN